MLVGTMLVGTSGALFFLCLLWLDIDRFGHILQGSFIGTVSPAPVTETWSLL